MSGIRVERWIKSATSMEPFFEHFGEHLVAYPYGSEKDAFGGQLITMTPEAETVGLRRYDTGEVREFPWFTTNFKTGAHIHDAFAHLAVGAVRQFEWFHNADGHPLPGPVTLTGTVDVVTPEAIDLWVLGGPHQGGGWWARIKADDAAKHSLRPPAAPSTRE